MSPHIKIFSYSLLFASLILLLSTTAFAAEKLTAEELVARHLQSIGTKEALAARTTCLAQGQTVMQNVTGSIEPPLVGQATLVSDGQKYRLRVLFKHPTYPSEQFAFDGKNFETGFLDVGTRSPLATFLYTYSAIGKEGLLGGVLNTAWALNDIQNKAPKLTYRGLKKIDGKDFHELRYQMKKGQDLQMTITMYFEGDTYRHVTTVYSLDQSGTGSLGERDIQSINQSAVRYELQEVFDNFKVINGLTIPTHWRMLYTIQSGQNITTTQWDTNFAQITFNRPIDAKVFVIN